MKNIILVLTFLLVASTYSHNAQAQNLAKSLCEYVSVDDKSRLRSFLRTNKLKIRNIFDSVKCNGQNLIEFAGTSNSLDTGTLMIAKLPKTKVEDLLSSITSPALAAAANKRVNG